MRISRSQPAPTRLSRPLAAVTFATAAILFAATVGRAEKVEDLRSQGYVSDFAGLLNANTEVQINALCAEVDQRAHAQLAVVTIHSLGGAPVEDFANKLYQRWGIGYKGENRGALLLFAANDHKYRVEVGYGLEPILPDGKVGGFAREVVPLLRQGDYNQGLLTLTELVARVIARDRGVELSRLPSGPRYWMYMESRTRPGPPSRWALLLTLILTMLAFGGLGSFLLFIIAVRQGRFGPIRRGPWITGSGRGWYGGSFGGSGGGGGFGGFGGGISGGGGASGSW